jgi:hypothetical protein
MKTNIFVYVIRVCISKHNDYHSDTASLSYFNKRMFFRTRGFKTGEKRLSRSLLVESMNMLETDLRCFVRYRSLREGGSNLRYASNN